jgi:hypothetical protein
MEISALMTLARGVGQWGQPVCRCGNARNTGRLRPDGFAAGYADPDPSGDDWHRRWALLCRILHRQAAGHRFHLGRHPYLYSYSRRRRDDCHGHRRGRLRRFGAQALAFILGGGVAAATHAVKAGSRVVINTSPEPFSNWGASITEDGLAIGGITLAVFYPVGFLVLFA